MVYYRKYTNKEDFYKWYRNKEFLDPLVVDISGIKNIVLSNELKRDYVLVEDFVNKGKNGEISIKKPIPGYVKFGALAEKAAKFGRELVIVYNDTKHYNYLKDLLNERIRTIEWKK